MLHQMFYFGVILPTTLLILFFILFLVCWFKCGLKERFSRNNYVNGKFKKGGSHNSTQSSLVTTSSGLPYANGPPSKDYWEVDREHDTSVDRKEPKYIPGEFSVRSDDWIYMSHELAQNVAGARVGTETSAQVQVHVWTTRGETLLDNHGSKPAIDGRASPGDISINSDHSSPDSLSRLNDVRILPLRVMDDSPTNYHWRKIPNPDRLPHCYPATAAGFEFTDVGVRQNYSCLPYAVTNLIYPPTPVIRV